MDSKGPQNVKVKNRELTNPNIDVKCLYINLKGFDFIKILHTSFNSFFISLKLYEYINLFIFLSGNLLMHFILRMTRYIFNYIYIRWIRLLMSFIYHVYIAAEHVSYRNPAMCLIRQCLLCFNKILPTSCTIFCHTYSNCA